MIKRKLTVADELGPLVKKLRVRKVGFQADNLPVATANTFRKVVRPARLLVEPGLVAKMRLLKQADELRRIRKAVDVAQQAYRKTLRSIRVGQTELDIAARLEFEMKKRGSQRPSFDSIVAEGPNAALPHAVPGKRKVRSGSALLFDWGAQVDWYCSDITRVAFVDRIPPRLSRVYDIVLEAQLNAIEAVEPGAELAAVDAVARKHIKRAGYGKYFGHGLGHGLGMYVHEAPSVRWSSTGELEPGMVVTIEPGIYLPGVGGVRIEDDVLVTERGHRVLTTLSKDRQAAVI
jgi:Xaa-Pro aminopeptidase